MRRAASASILGSARKAARAAGVSRLSDITRLDRIGLPVWQAVRPESRALSVHQGKGATRLDAQIGALLEAVESHAAETFDAPVSTASWAALDPAVRPRHLEDFAHERDAPPCPESSVPWVEATRPDGRPLMVPFEAVSLDFTRFRHERFEQASAGLATGTSVEEASRAALLELIERDAVSRFMRARFSQRLACEIDEETVAFDWFGALRERMARAGVSLRLFAPASPIGVPVFLARLDDDAKEARPYAATVGHAAHPDPEHAIFKAVAEALQSRLTFISGARDDCWPWDYTAGRSGMLAAVAPPPNAAIDAIAFEAIPGPSRLEELVARLETLGVTETAFLQIAQPEGFSIMRAFAPGLGSLANEARL